jgi:hypothetical protein
MHARASCRRTLKSRASAGFPGIPERRGRTYAVHGQNVEPRFVAGKLQSRWCVEKDP